MRNSRQIIALVFCLTAPMASFGAAEKAAAKTTQVFIEAQDGFEVYLEAAIIKKQVPVTIVTDEHAANFVLKSAPVVSKEESGAGKIARCAFAYCAGINGTQTVSVQLVNPGTTSVVWAYSVRKGGASNYQSSAEAVAKHLKGYLEDAAKKEARNK